MPALNRSRENIFAALGAAKAELVIKNALVLNVFTEQFEPADIAIQNGVIVGLGRYEGAEEVNAHGRAVVPGFIDSHVHLESTLISPKQFCKAVLPHGTTAVVADPHEITNVLGVSGFRYMLEETKGLPLDVYMMVPSCVPATPFDESGAIVTAEETALLLTEPGVLGLAEMMNFPGVLAANEEILQKLATASRECRPIDGHAPGLSGKALNAYITAGAHSDHECTNADEAKEKLRLGQWIMIREGTAGKNLSALLPLFEKPWCDRCMLATDDKDPGDLIAKGHIDHSIRKAIALGANPVCAYKMASFNAAAYFGLSRSGAIAPGYVADLVILNDVQTVNIHCVYKNGRRVDNAMDTLFAAAASSNPYTPMVHNTVQLPDLTAERFQLKKPKEKVIGLVSGEILTTDEGYTDAVDIDKDICKLSVVERHHCTGHIGIAFVKGYGLKKGAIATSVAHDSHNIIAIGTNDEDMSFAVNRIRALQGGMTVVQDKTVIAELPLPIAGLMCDLDAAECAEILSRTKAAAHALGVNKDIDPFMTLSFASLAVIPTLRLTTLGVVDVTKFELLP